MKKKQSPKSTELSLLQLNFHSNVYVAPAVVLGIRYSNSAVSLPGFVVLSGACAVLFQGLEKN